MVKIYLKPQKEQSVLRFHPWVFSGAIQRVEGQPSEGEIVEVYDSKQQFLAQGHYQVGSIAVRILAFTACKVDVSFWKEAILRAYELRVKTGLVHENNTIYRLIHGEGDGLPGLIVDVYADTAVLQAHSVGMHLVRETLAALLVEQVPQVHKVYYKSESTLPFMAPIDAEDGYLIGPGNTHAVAVENNMSFHIDWTRGQKTGFFVDQRENRLLLEQYARNRSVLNMFSYSGGFSVFALRGGAQQVHSVDSSLRAIELANKNVALNFPNDSRHTSFSEDAFKFLNQSSHAYDLIVLDPPAFAKHRDALRNALKGYQRLNAKGISKVKQGGIVFTFSCSQIVSKEQFRLAVFSAAAETGRKVRILHQLSQPADHPVNIYHPEGEYLKGLVLYVE